MAGAAITAAALAAWTANRRMERQLAEESVRLQAQLTHDRRVRESEELRGVLDDAAACSAVVSKNWPIYWPLYWPMLWQNRSESGKAR